ncbi:6-phosphofructo-2-kinase/fructose-2,6-bisphosphatase 1-like [Dysidea avara]|uniref:6-phosphofructo-2-kinase/fructose-2, 6-bisphosphatase 1-like n=1 Tax=Dysidea avara TaxID=196820 RepID=UPI00332B20F8
MAVPLSRASFSVESRPLNRSKPVYTRLSEKSLDESEFGPSNTSPSCPQYIQSKLCIVTVGLPARGKTYVAMKLARYLRWIGINTKVFNVGNYRRKNVGARQSHTFFDPTNKDAIEQRMKCAHEALKDVVHYLYEEDGQVAVFDATNTTRERRHMIAQECHKNLIKVFYIELVCNDEELITENVKEVKVTSPDYVGVDTDEAVQDFCSRIKQYETAYEPLDMDFDRERSWVKLIDVNRRVVANRVVDHLQSRLVYFLMNMHIKKRNIYICRHGESECNMLGQIGGDSDLSPRGKEFSVKLADFINGKNIPGLKVWTSQLKRTIETSRHLNVDSEQWKSLNELDAGACDSLTYEEIQERFPEEFALRDQDKYYYRYPRGESYDDLVHRLEPVILALERQENILVICHQAVMRCLLAYFLDKSQEELPYIKCPLHTVLKLTPKAYRCEVESFPIDVPAVDTHRSKPKITDPTRSLEEALENLPEHY